MHIADFISELSDLPMSDLLVQIEDSKRCIELNPSDSGNEWSVPLTSDWSALLKTATSNKREADIDSLCITEVIIEWKYTSTFIHTPLILSPLYWKQHLGNQTIQLKKETENWIFNPFVKWFLSHVCNCPIEVNEDEELHLFKERLFLALKEQSIDFQVINRTIVGNFHHHRFFVLRDLELIEQVSEKSRLLETILGNESFGAETIPRKQNGKLVPLDRDQVRAFQASNQSNLVIQGPPGTGKSQVLTALIGDSIAHFNSTLVVSEKRVALEVLVKKMGEFGLENFCFIAHSQVKAHDFIQQLKTSWIALEQLQVDNKPFAFTSQQRMDQLQLLLERLGIPDLVGGVSLRSALKLKNNIIDSSTPFKSNVPSIAEWEVIYPEFKNIEAKYGSLHVLGKFKAYLFKQSNYDQLLKQLGKEATFICANYQVDTLSDLEQEWKNTIRIQLLDNEASKIYWTVNDSKKARKQWDKNVSSFKQIQQTKTVLEKELAIWKKVPTRTQLESWVELLNSKLSWWKKKQLNRTIIQHLIDSSIQIEIAISQLQNYYSALSEEENLIAEFQQLGIERPDLEIDAISYLFKQLESEDQNELNSLSKLSSIERKSRLKHQQRLKHFIDDLNRYCTLQQSDSILNFFSSIESNLTQLADMSAHFQLFSDSILDTIASCSSVEQMNSCILDSNWKKFEQMNPNLAQITGEEIHRLTQQMIESETEESMAFVRQIWSKRKIVFEEYALLLRTPAAKLTAENRAKKTQLKNGKRILVKEFSKSKSHPTIRELYESDAKIWIDLLLPIWLSTPSQVAKLLPMEKELFDLLLLDEASQIPLPNALGSLQRSKYTVIAGDEQQMAPSNYFGKSISSNDILSYATYYYPKTMLTHHYRSSHPDLISFSNRYFYGNQLVVYPSPNQTCAIHDHFTENGIYENRCNLIEAAAVAQFISTLNPEISWGIVAFSEIQLEQIWKACSLEVQERIQSKISDDTAFFKSLEQIQGDEADCMVISFGYGKNVDGSFALRFGPVNQQNGAKRLNVLFSRAKQEMHWFSSVRAHDFSISTNEAVNLLRLFFTELTVVSKTNALTLPYQLVATTINKGLKIEGIHEQLSNARELVTFQRVMQARGWSIRYV